MVFRSAHFILRVACLSLLVAAPCSPFFINVSAADPPIARRAAWTGSRLQGTPEPPAPYRIAPAFPKLRFDRPTCLEPFPSGNRLLVTEMDGKIYSFAAEGDTRTANLVGDLRQLLGEDAVSKGRSVSLFDAELHPRFNDNHHVFVCYVHPGSNATGSERHTRVSRFTLTDDESPRLVPGSELVVIRWPAGGHNGGCLEFGIDGYLYISTGDGSGPNPPDGRTTGQDVSDLLGAVLRIDVDGADAKRPFRVPADNPFVGRQGARPEIWAYGLRNPWKFGIDPKTGQVFAADNGWETWEMVHRITRGGNCGWPVMEGRATLRGDVPVGPTPIVPPVMDHPHTEANSVIGGPVYRGEKLPELVGSFVYGDYITGTIWSIRQEPDGSYSHQTLVDTDQRIVAFTQANQGQLYVLDYDLTGQIYELLPSGLPDLSGRFPRRLSETGLFASLETMQPAPGVVPYTVVASRWMDGAVAQRWVAIPGTAGIRLAANTSESGVSGASAQYPEGTVFVKHLTLPPLSRSRDGASTQAIRLETQLLHFEAGTWRPYSYLWDDDGTDAQLVSNAGATRALRVTVSHSDGGPDGTVNGEVAERTWRVSAANECKLCHNIGSHYVLGFTLNQLNRPSGQPPSAPSNQLVTLFDEGILSAPPVMFDGDLAQLVDPHDATLPLDDRARSYLHANCAMCHHPGGNAIVSFYLRRELPLDKLNTNKGTGIGTFGMRDARIIVPGDPYRSVLLYRLSKLGYARMPYIGSQVVDSRGVALVERWIRSLANAPMGTASGPVTSGSTEDNDLRALVAGTATPEERRAMIRRLTASTEGALALVAHLHRGAIPHDGAKEAVDFGSHLPAADVRGLFETFVPEAGRRATLGPRVNPDSILENRGDVERGKLIFYSDGARCRACHDIDNRDLSLGPTLREINKKYPRSADLIQHVIQPSLKIDEPYAAYAVVTDDGTLVSGLLHKTTDQEVVIRTNDKKLVTLARNRIDELRKSTRSLMPELLLSDLTAQEAADLLAFIQSLGGSE